MTYWPEKPKARPVPPRPSVACQECGDPGATVRQKDGMKYDLCPKHIRALTAKLIAEKEGPCG